MAFFVLVVVVPTPVFHVSSVMRLRARRHGFSLVELLVVVALIGVLVSLLLPAVQAAREAARRAHCQNNLRQIGVALTLHTDTHGAYPVGCIGCWLNLSPGAGPPAPQRFISWNVHLLPLIEQTQLWKAFDQTLPSYDAKNLEAGATVVSTFLCPSTHEENLHNRAGLWSGFAFTDYAGIYGVEGVGHDIQDVPWETASQTLRDESLGVLIYDSAVAPRHITDGLANTAVVAETVLRRQSESEWVNGHNLFAQDATTPVNVARKRGNEIGSPHPGGAMVVFCDGHVEFVAETIDQIVLNAWLTKAGGELP